MFISGPWDLEIPTNVILYERPPSLLPHPQPEVMTSSNISMKYFLEHYTVHIVHIVLYTLYTLQVEVVRFQLMYKLRQSYQEMCHSREGIDAPKESFNR